MLSFIVEDYDYVRMVDSECSGIDITKSYEEFLEWNRLCISKLSPDDLTWLQGLCKRIQTSQLCQMDLESCSMFETSYFYFNKQKQLCFVNPR